MIIFGVFTLLGGGECKCIFETSGRFVLAENISPNPPLGQTLYHLPSQNYILLMMVQKIWVYLGCAISAK